MSKTSGKPHPMQEIVLDSHGVARYRENAIVRWMLEKGGRGERFDLCTIAGVNFTDQDMMQFAMLIGYSVSGAGDLSYFDPRVTAQADRKVQALANPSPVSGPKCHEESGECTHPGGCSYAQANIALGEVVQRLLAYDVLGALKVCGEYFGYDDLGSLAHDWHDYMDGADWDNPQRSDWSA